MAMLDDCAHFWGGDLLLSATGDLARASGSDRSKQRVLRRLLTNPGGYQAHTEYGGGLPQDVGSLVDVASTKAKISGQMLLEASVAPAPPPVVAARTISGGLAVSAQYVSQDGQPLTLSFSVDA